MLDRIVGRGRARDDSLVGLFEELPRLILRFLTARCLLLGRQLGTLLDPVVAHRHCVPLIAVAYPSGPWPSTTSP